MDLLTLQPYRDFFFIAEAGVNHEGSLAVAIQMVESAAKAGADAIKFQAYTAKNLAHKSLAQSYWDTNSEKNTSQYDLFSKYESFSLEEWITIKKACEHNSIEFWLSIFDVELAHQLAPICDGLKVASGDLTFKRLHSELLGHQKPTIFSLGASLDSEIVELSTQITNANACALFCRLIYPTDDNSANLCDYPVYSKKFPIIKGISDHCREGTGESVLLAYALGASIVEKHFTLDSSLSGNDHYHSITPHFLNVVVNQIKRMRDLYGSLGADNLMSQASSRTGARRSLFFTQSFQQGHIVESNDIIELRPVVGIPASDIDCVIGKKLTSDVLQGDPVHWPLLS